MNHQRGFTLIELMLVVVVLMAFMVSAVIYMSPAFRAIKLEEGASRFESMLKFASAEAMQTGKRVLIRFTATNDFSGRVIYIPRVAMEKNPIGEPGVFTGIERVAWLDESVVELISIVSIVHAEAEEEDEKIDAEEMEDNEGGFLGGNLLDNNNIGATTNIEDTVNSSNVSDFSFTNTSNGGYFAMYGHVEDDFNTEEEAFEGSAMLDGNQEETPSVLFYPDGSSQTIEVRLISTDEEDLRQVIICLNGITGLIEKRIYQVEEDTGEIDEESGEDLDTDQIDEEEKTVEFEEESLEDNFQRNQETGETNFGIKNVL